MEIYDSHTHLNDPLFYDDVPAFLARATHLGVTQMNIVGSNLILNVRAIKLARKFANLHAVIGWHPEEATDYRSEILEATLTNSSVVGVGEIGLDYVNGVADRDLQKQVFKAQLTLAQKFHLPSVIHCREALGDTYDLLKKTGIVPGKIVMHSFSGDANWAARFLDLGAVLSFSGVASFNRAEEVQAAVKFTPLNRMLVETDAPYLTPVPYRGKWNEPAYTYYVIQAIAALKQVTPEKVAQTTYVTTAKLFSKARISLPYGKN